MASDVDVVVLDEHELVRELRIAHHLRDFLQHALAGIVARMRFAGENELHGPLRIVDHGGEPFDIAQDQVGALVSGEAARETDGERIRAEYAGKSLQCLPAARCGARPAAPRGDATNSSRRDFRLRCVSQSSPSSTFSMPSQIRASLL